MAMHKGMTGREPVSGDNGPATLKEYLVKRYPEEMASSKDLEVKKLTFEEWWENNKTEYPYWFQNNTVPAKAIWQAAQENV